MMMKRSHHMPTLMRMEAIQSQAMLVRAFFHQKICGTTTLQNDHRPVDARVGPAWRGVTKNCKAS